MRSRVGRVGLVCCHSLTTASGIGKAGATLSPIDGMPVGIKDIMETADMATEQGSPLFVGWHGKRDCAAVAALREAGSALGTPNMSGKLAGKTGVYCRERTDAARNGSAYT